MFEDKGHVVSLGGAVTAVLLYIFRGDGFEFWFTLVLCVLSAIVWVGRAAERRAATSWPAAPGHVEFAEVRENAEGIEGMLRPHVLHLAYSYKALDERYSGFTERRFRRDADAQAALVRLKGSDVPVRYDPRNPETSLLTI